MGYEELIKVLNQNTIVTDLKTFESSQSDTVLNCASSFSSPMV